MKKSYSNKILKLLSEKSAVSLPALTKSVREQAGVPESNNRVSTPNSSKSPLYAITRSLKGLREAGLVENINSGQNDYARLTKEGKKRAHSLMLDSETTLVNTSWDGMWRIILLDLPEDRKNEREALRYLLKKADFICLKNSAWISPLPYEHLFTSIKKDLGLTTEMIIITTDQIDKDTKKFLFEIFGK